MKRSVSIRDIARDAKVSHATVSYVLNGLARRQRIPPGTERRIRLLAERNGWQPSHVRASFTTGKTRLIGLWQPKFAIPFQAWVMQSVEKATREDGYGLLVSPAHYDEQADTYDLTLFSRWSVDGLLTLSRPGRIRAFLNAHPQWDLPMVVMGTHVLQGYPRIDSVYVDVFTPVQEALARWADEGRRRIAMLSGHDPDVTDIYPGEQFYHDFMVQRGLKEELVVFSKGASQRDSAGIAIRAHVAAQGCPDAIFCRSDEDLMGAYKALRDLGINIPADVALLGTDGIQDTRYLDHPVSTVVQPVEAMCRTAWELLKDRFDHPERPPRHEVLPCTLEWRT